VTPAPPAESSLFRGVGHPALRGLVRGYADYAERSAGPVRMREPAAPYLPVIVDLADGWRIRQGGEEQDVGSFAGGLHDGPTEVEHPGRARVVQVDLEPLAARALFGLPLRELAHLVVPLDALLGADAERLAERLADAASPAERFAILDRVLLDRLARATPPRPDVARAWDRLVATGGTVPVEALARELGCSRRHLAARFGEEVGLSPKRVARLLRFRRAHALLTARPHTALAALAADCGYADQAHLTREFRALAGTTPAAYAASVPFVQERTQAAA